MTVTILRGDCRSVLAGMPAESVHMVVTSPPYWGLRDYGIAPTVWGGDPGCEHEWSDPVVERRTNYTDKRKWQHTRNGRDEAQPIEKRVDRRHTEVKQGQFCQCCGAWAGALGLEPTINLYVEHMVEVFRAVHRVLRKDATCWLNIGDSYATKPHGPIGANTWDPKYPGGRNRGHHGNGEPANALAPNRMPQAGLKHKDLCMIPARVALALQADGWYLRQDIIWHKPNPMPESCRDRCTKAHEYLFLLSKGARYHYDAKAIAEEASDNTHARTGMIKMPDGWDTGAGGHGSYHRKGREKGKTRKTDSTNESHVPNASPHGGIHRAGTPRGGRPPGVTPKSAPEGSLIRAKESWHASTTEVLDERNKRSVWTVATAPFPDAHFATFPPALIEPCILAGSPKDGTVLDPFGGAGTTGLVAERLGRNAILIEMSPGYCEMAATRIRQDCPLFTDIRHG